MALRQASTYSAAVRQFSAARRDAASFKSKQFCPEAKNRGNPCRSSRWAGLEELPNPDVGVAVLPTRAPAAMMHAAYAALAELPIRYGDAPQLELSAVQDDNTKSWKIQSWLASLLPGQGEIETSRAALAEDVFRCARIYEEANAYSSSSTRPSPDVRKASTGHYHVSLELCDRPGCPRFHLDTVKVRLLRYYFGPTTETVDSEDINWEAFNNHGTNEQSVPKLSDVVRRIPDGAVALFKGRKYHKDIARTGCVHRSPGLDVPGWVFNSKGEPRRMLLKIDNMCSN